MQNRTMYAFPTLSKYVFSSGHVFLVCFVKFEAIFVSLLHSLQNIVLSLLAQQMHDAGLTSDTGDLVGSRPPPATEELIENLTKRKITAEMKGTEFKLIY